MNADRKVVKPARPGEAGFIRRVEDVAALAEESACVLGRQILEESLRIDACPASKEPLGVGAGKADRCRDIIEPWLVPPVLFQVVNGLRDTSCV